MNWVNNKIMNFRHICDRVAMNLLLLTEIEWKITG